MNILLGVTGSVASMRTPALVTALIQLGHKVKVIATEPAFYFFDDKELPANSIVRDADEWPGIRYQRDDPVLHIELRKWADRLVIAPLDANTLAKLAHGLADNCLTCVARAWDTTRPMILAPAMNTLMWHRPTTSRHLRLLAEDFGLVPPHVNNPVLVAKWINDQRSCLRLVGPIEKALACGDVGIGGMADLDDIIAAIG